VVHRARNRNIGIEAENHSEPVSAAGTGMKTHSLPHPDSLQPHPP